MTPMVEIGEVVISTDKKDYLFRPSFSNMTKIGGTKQIVEAYGRLNGTEIQSLITRAVVSYRVVPEWLIKAVNKPTYGRNILQTAMIVMQACCDDDCEEIIGEWRVGKRGVIYQNGKMPIADIIMIAKELFIHGIIGKVKLRKLQRNEDKNEFSNEFKAIDYISSARAHFGMTRTEAEQLTMTEFQMMLKAKYPDEKGFTRKEYDEIMKADDKRNDELASGKRRLVSKK